MADSSETVQDRPMVTWMYLYFQLLLLLLLLLRVHTYTTIRSTALC